MSAAVSVRPIVLTDGPRIIELNRASADLHHPWVDPPTDEAAMDTYLRRQSSDDFCGLLAVTAAGDPVGVFSLSQIFRGGFQNAYLGFYGFVGMVGRGLMAEGLRAALRYAFGPLRLHRVEANVQPANARSIALVQRVGFRLEGFSPRYLFIDGAWRDHERYAMTLEDHAALDG